MGPHELGMVDNTMLYEAKKVHHLFGHGTATHVDLRVCNPTVRFHRPGPRGRAAGVACRDGQRAPSIGELLRAELTPDRKLWLLVLIEEERRYYSDRCPEAQEGNCVPEGGTECDEPEHNARQN